MSRAEVLFLGTVVILSEIDYKGEISVKKLYGYSPPFGAFLIEMLNIGRILVIENFNMDGAAKERADSG